MTKQVADFLLRLEKEQQKIGRLRDPSYGAAVMPVLEIYKRLTTFEDRRAFQDALEMLLTDEDQAKRSFAVDVCLGFFVFRDSL